MRAAKRRRSARPPAALDLVLSHDARCWRADGEGLTVAAGSLTELERMIAHAARERLGGDRDHRVSVRFDHSQMPCWLRQYQPHYFNYTLLVEASS